MVHPDRKNLLAWIYSIYPGADYSDNIAAYHYRSVPGKRSDTPDSKNRDDRADNPFPQFYRRNGNIFLQVVFHPLALPYLRSKLPD
ncbi:hypothetical protein D3C73_777550 [compost metagenome]